MADLGAERSVDAVVALGTLVADDVEVQLIHGVVGQQDEILDPEVVPMSMTGKVDDAHVRYSGSFACDRAGRHGLTVRVVPASKDLVVSAELGKIAWA